MDNYDDGPFLTHEEGLALIDDWDEADWGFGGEGSTEEVANDNLPVLPQAPAAGVDAAGVVGAAAAIGAAVATAADVATGDAEGGAAGGSVGGGGGDVAAGDSGELGDDDAGGADVAGVASGVVLGGAVGGGDAGEVEEEQPPKKKRVRCGKWMRKDEHPRRSARLSELEEKKGEEKK